jgi:hypothetical protein
MEPELQKSDYVEAGESGVTPEQGGTLATASASEGDTQWQQILEQVYEILSGLPEYIGKFYGEYRQPIVTVGLIVAALVSVKLVLALLSAINEIPLLAPTFELVGLGYGGWFVYRYMLRASSRQELYGEFKVLKDQVVGQKSSDS